jgi:hypothetical protein
MLGVGCLEMASHSVLHHLTTAIGLSFLLFWQIVVYRMCFSSMTTILKVVRLMFLLAELPGFAMAGFAEDFTTDRIAITISTLGEYLLLGSMLLFTLTYSWDLRDYQILLSSCDYDAKDEIIVTED